MTMTQGDLEAYLARIEYTGPRDVSVQTLTGLHQAHTSHIPFENVDVVLGRGIDLDPAALQQKLVTGRRGGYCFEHNLLFDSALRALGFAVTDLTARVRFGAAGVRPRTHMLLRVDVAGDPWIADVGFGSDGLVLPVPFTPYLESTQGLRTHRIVPEGAAWVMQSRRAGGDWVDLYVFSLEAHERIDYDVLNHYTATHPRSIFRSLLLAQFCSLDRRVLLRNRELTVETEGGMTTRRLSEREVEDELRETFGLHLPPGTVLNVPE
jgi:N-hydroxyarylamine O-acetyltransferase